MRPRPESPPPASRGTGPSGSGPTPAAPRDEGGLPTGCDGPLSRRGRREKTTRRCHAACFVPSSAPARALLPAAPQRSARPSCSRLSACLNSSTSWASTAVSCGPAARCPSTPGASGARG
eukprot:6981189-Pyramimonas_sp.AAC.1